MDIQLNSWLNIAAFGRFRFILALTLGSRGRQVDFLGSNSLRLEPLIPDLIGPDYIATLNDKNYMQYSRHVKTEHTLKSQLEYISHFNNFDSWIYSISTVERGTFIGTTNLFFDFQERHIDIGFLIFKNFCGKGYAGQVLEILLKYLKDEFPNFQINIGTNKANIPMRRIAEKAGFSLQDSDLDYSINVKYYYLIDPIIDFDRAKIPLFIRWAKNIGVVAFDAGGAEQIKWLISELDTPIKALIDGPAKSIFRESKLNFDEVSSISDLNSCQLIITGSGWMSNLEQEAISFCKKRKIASVTLLDHWVNYKERFHSSADLSPSLLIVTNQAALNLALQNFPEQSVLPCPDFQIANYKSSLSKKAPEKNCVLILLEPLTNHESNFAVNENTVLDLARFAFELSEQKGLNGVTLRLHPSQIYNNSKFEKLTELFPTLLFSNNRELLIDFKKSGAVLGFNSYGLYLSAKCGIETFSPFKGLENHWTNLFSEIMGVRES